MGRKKGYKMSEEQKSKISKANTGKKKPTGFNIGRIHSEETKKKISKSNKGISPSKETRMKISICNRGKHNSPKTEFKKGSEPWNKGKAEKVYCDEGYLRKNINGKVRRIHRVIVETNLGRKLREEEVIHHINGKRNDNRISNLRVMSRSEHMKLHRNNRK